MTLGSRYLLCCYLEPLEQLTALLDSKLMHQREYGMAPEYCSGPNSDQRAVPIFLSPKM